MSQSGDAVGPIFDAALELSSAQRAAFLDRACAGAPAVRQRVEALLRAHQTAGGFMESPAVGPMPRTPDLLLKDQSGERIGSYKLLQQIGEGGCGVVYMAEQEHPIRRRVALKVIKLGMDTKRVIARFEAERQALALMDHPNIAKVLDAGATEAGRPFFVMELVAGEKITGYCDARNLGMPQRLALFVQVCRAIQHAHQKGIIHRDLKPSNILVTEQDGHPVPRVIDFGIAKATGDLRLTDKTLFTAFEQFIGTPAYMSPEQAGLGRLDVDTRSDIYSLGVLLYELLTGRPPFDAAELGRAALDQVLQTIRDKDPPRPSTRLTRLTQQELTKVARSRQTEPPKLLHQVRGDLDWIVMKALEKDRGRRYDTANGLAMDVERHLQSQPVVARPASAAYRLEKLVLRNKLAFSAVGAVAATLVLGIIVSTAEALRARRAASLAQAAAGEARSNLARFHFAEANRLIEAHDGPDAVPYLVRILSDKADHSAALTRLATLLTYHTWFVPTFAVKHEAWVTSAQFSVDGKLLVNTSGDGDCSARVWDAQTGQPVTERLQHLGPVNSAQFSPDGRRILTASRDATAQIWDAHTSQVVVGPLKHGAAVNLAAFSPEGRRVLTGSDDLTARLWDAETGQPLGPVLKHAGPVTCAAFSTDGQRIVTGSADKTARIWDAQTGQRLADPLQHSGPVCFVQFSPDGQRIATASWDNTAVVWDARTGQPLTEPLKHEDQVLCACFSPDGVRLVTASRDKTARIWDARTGRPVTRRLQHARAVEAAQFSPDGKRILTASADNTARVWDAQTGQPLSEPLQHPQAIWSARFSPDGQRVVTSSADRTARVWDVQTFPPLSVSFKHQGSVVSAQFSPDGTHLVTASADATARIWDVRTGQPVAQALRHKDVVEDAQFSPDGRSLVTASYDHTARVWDTTTGMPLTGPLWHSNRLNSARFSPDGLRIVTASDDSTAKVWDARTGLLLTEPLWHGGRVLFAEFSPDGQRILTANWDRTARLWGARSGQLLLESFKHTGVVTCAEFSPDGRRVVTGSTDRTARVWDAQTGHPLTPPLQHGQYVFSVRFSPDGTHIATASRDNTARLWDARTGRPLSEPLQHENSVEFVEFSPDGRWLVTASTDTTARFWDVETGQPLSEPFKHGAKVFTARFSPDGKRVLTASRDRTARLWDVGFAPSRCPAWLLQLAEALAGNRLNPQGLLEPTSLDRAQTIARIRQQLREQPDDADGVGWGRWLLADRSTRAASPFSGSTIPAYVQDRLGEVTAESLEEAAQAEAGNVELQRRVEAVRGSLERTNPQPSF
jgi:eukaryotic-like serine/threonine-protein kinase